MQKLGGGLVGGVVLTVDGIEQCFPEIQIAQAAVVICIAKIDGQTLNGIRGGGFETGVVNVLLNAVRGQLNGILKTVRNFAGRYVL